MPSGATVTEDLRVDTALVRQSGAKLQTIAGLIPEAPAPFSPAGTDALSTAIAGKVAEVVDPVIAQMPITKEELTRYAQNVMAAADRYDATDRQIAEDILKRLGLLDETVGAGGGAPGTPVSGGTPAAAPAAGAGQTDQMGQLMQMPMQLAQQAAQIPMQLASMAAAIPQAIMQGVQSAAQQASQMAEMSSEERLADEDPKLDVEEQPKERAEPRSDEAAPGGSSAERAPEPAPQESKPEPPSSPKPAPTRPAEATIRVAL
ncbi:hypothetical protein BST36_25070 [Mycolicibacterium moriokaense]|uniref:PE domain-containing protein n=1 Tax=Mycolicibacterium moriokaense TaxID=39691 RepID=A0AAD1M427_9MYCO|nr:hypothetical protein BST36_25070 [Mycolicibacterium moriokaense]BBW99731.1 hypothetical protein MMOR_06680 [Mycolicibacterium moriokaense]